MLNRSTAWYLSDLSSGDEVKSERARILQEQNIAPIDEPTQFQPELNGTIPPRPKRFDLHSAPFDPNEEA